LSTDGLKQARSSIVVDLPGQPIAGRGSKANALSSSIPEKQRPEYSSPPTKLSV